MADTDLSSGRPAHPFGAELWCEALREAKDSQRLSYDHLARETRYNRGKLVEIITGRRRPSIEELLRVASVLRLSQVRMLDIAGHLPGLSNLLAYVDRLEDLASRTNEAGARPLFTGVQGAAAIVDRVAATGEYKVSIHALWQGTGVHRIHYADMVVVDSLDDHLHEGELRERLEKLLFDELTWFSAGFVDRPDAARGLGAHFPSLVVQVPRFIAPRRATTNSLPGAPHSVCVLGSHWSGSDDVASALGAGLGHDYASVTMVAVRAYSRLNHASTLSGQDKIEVAMTYLSGGGVGRMRTWAADGEIYVRAARLLGSGVRARDPFVVHLRSTDALLEWTAYTRERWGHVDSPGAENLRLATQERAAVDRLLAPIGHRVLTMPAHLPEGVDFKQPDEDGRDVFMNLWCNAAEEIFVRLNEEHGMRIDVDEARSRARSLGCTVRPER